jgi:hypothetical protein
MQFDGIVRKQNPSMWERFRQWLLDKLRAVDTDDHTAAVVAIGSANFNAGYATGKTDGYKAGLAEGETHAKLKFALLPLPFSTAQMEGRYYGEFITPAGFATQFGECNIPAPGPNGYEQRAYYVSKTELDYRPSETDLRCHAPNKFDHPWDSERLVPVIVTVLR